MAEPYVLYYYPIPARGEFIQLILEVVGHPYREVRDTAAIMEAKDSVPGCVHFAHPILQISETFSLSQTPVICAYLARKHGLMPEGEGKDLIAMQLDHTVHDILVEVQATHHPIEKHSLDMAGRRRRVASLKSRLPLQLGHLEKRVISHSEGQGPYLFGKELCYVDLSIAFLLQGLEHSFPTFYTKLSEDMPGLVRLRSAVFELEQVRRYIQSNRRQGFSNGIFRYAAELDDAE